MNGIPFFKKGEEKTSAIINSIDRLSNNSYLWVTSIAEHESWCSEKTKDLFQLPSQSIFNIEHHIIEYVHPDDRQEYREELESRINAIHLGKEFCVRIRMSDEHYAMFSFHTSLLFDDQNEPEYLIVVISNENIFREFDALTDLYSETRYIADLEKMITRGDNFAILQIHVKGFSTFNLIYGRDFSHELLQAIALRFIYMMDSDKIVYHLENEHFVFILKKAGRKELLDFEKQVRDTLDAGIMANGKLHPLKMAAGAILLENNQEDISAICGQVTYALNHSIGKHQGQLVIFNDEVQTSRGADLALMKVIHQSVLNDCEGFFVLYQPIVDSSTGDIVGAEALVRWSLEPYGTIPPGMFIEWLETDPSMYDLGNFVLRTALLETKEILTRKPDFFVNVNISIRQLERSEFHQDVLSILAETGFPADHLCMELTERCRDFPVDLLNREVCFFQSYGIRVAMDDYGTGSASSNLVMNIPMDEIKIDMSFIREIKDNPKNQAMVHSILSFAEKCHIATCLEGVENEELQDYLRTYNATWFQGYYYSKPVPIDELKKMLG